MFHNHVRKDDEKLRRVLNDSWPLDVGKDKESFLHKLRLVIPPDHPGLLFLTGRIKRQVNNGYDSHGDAKWKLRNVFATVATWGLILVILVAAVYIVKATFLYSPPSGSLIPEGTSGIMSAGPDTVGEKVATIKYVYKYGETKITRDEKLTLKQVTEEFNKTRPIGITVKITSMRQTEDYFEETDTATIHFIVYEVKGLEFPTGKPAQQGTGGTP